MNACVHMTYGVRIKPAAEHSYLITMRLFIFIFCIQLLYPDLIREI